MVGVLVTAESAWGSIQKRLIALGVERLIFKMGLIVYKVLNFIQLCSLHLMSVPALLCPMTASLPSTEELVN